MKYRTGQVFIAVDFDAGTPVASFVGYWCNDVGEIEDMPVTDSAVSAIRWGLGRTDDVRIRFDAWSYFWAGEGSMPEGEPGFAGVVSLL